LRAAESKELRIIGFTNEEINRKLNLHKFYSLTDDDKIIM